MQRLYAPSIRYVAIVALGLTALAVVSYVALKKQKAWPLLSYTTDTHTTSCANAQVVAPKKENPNKLLFISCGGFLQ